MAFLAFMSVSGIPAFIEERAVFLRERASGFYGPGIYSIANTVTILPFLFACSLLFTLIIYWAIGLNPGASHFFKFLAFLFISLFVAESQTVAISGLVPIFVAALALAAFANGFWMCVQGYFISTPSLPRFWFYSFHWMDFQTYAFQLLASNEFRGRVYQCSITASGCACPYPSSIASAGQCQIAGEDVLDALEISVPNEGLWVLYMLLIGVVFRLMFYAALRFRS